MPPVESKTGHKPLPRWPSFELIGFKMKEPSDAYVYRVAKWTSYTQKLLGKKG